MSANTSPIYSLTPNVHGAAVTAGNATSDGTGTVGSSSLPVIYTAGTNGSYVSVVRWTRGRQHPYRHDRYRRPFISDDAGQRVDYPGHQYLAVCRVRPSQPIGR